MGFTCGIVGLPNVGKSTLFNALTSSEAAATAAYPFSTIEPHQGRVAVPDPRLHEIARLARSPRRVPGRLDIVDIAGLVRGAHKGEGLGNQFLSHIREVEAVIHVVRCFEDANVPHPAGPVAPETDAEVVETELALADLQSLERRVESLRKQARGDPDAKAQLALVERVRDALGEGRFARDLALAGEEATLLAELNLLTAKPILFICNVDEASLAGNPLSDRAAAWARARGAPCLVIAGALEAELARFDDAAEQAAFIKELGIEDSGLARVIHAGYALLDLITFFTANANEAHAWPLRRGASALEAAGKVHSDFAKGFIRAETVAYEDFLACGGEHGAREAGKLRSEGRDYIVEDGDILLIRSSS